jgi:hypothetical protein
LLEPSVDADANRNRPRCRQPVRNAGEQGLERGQATTEEAVDVSALRNTGARFGARRQTIAFKHSHP